MMSNTYSDFCSQNILLDGLRLGGGGAIAVEFKSLDGKPLKHATVKAKGEGVETLPLYTNKDTIAGEVSHFFGSITF